MKTMWRYKCTWLTMPLKYALAVILLVAVCEMLVQTPARAAESCVLSAAAMADAEAGIKETIAAYNAALNGGHTMAVLPLYTNDGVFMPPYSESAVGKEAVKKGYDKVFDELKFHVQFAITELVVMAPTWAHVRTNSVGTTDHHSSGKTTAEANQELFIFEKGNDGKWRIARHSFSPTSKAVTQQVLNDRMIRLYWRPGKVAGEAQGT